MVVKTFFQCSLYLTQIRLKCHNLNVVESEIFKNYGSDRIVICIYCSNDLFTTINDYKLYQILNQNSNHSGGSSVNYSTKTWLELKPPKHLSNHFNEFNNFSSQWNSNTENIINCKYYIYWFIDEIQTLYLFFMLIHVLSLKTLKNVNISLAKQILILI